VSGRLNGPRSPGHNGPGKVGCPCTTLRAGHLITPPWLATTTYGVLGFKFWVCQRGGAPGQKEQLPAAGAPRRRAKPGVSQGRILKTAPNKE